MRLKASALRATAERYDELARAREELGDEEKASEIRAWSRLCRSEAEAIDMARRLAREERER